jgi:hypothetical protein
MGRAGWRRGALQTCVPAAIAALLAAAAMRSARGIGGEYPFLAGGAAHGAPVHVSARKDTAR